jgi:hypothetical protein
MLPKRRIAFCIGTLAAAVSVAVAQNTTFELGRVDFWRPADLSNNWIIIKEDGVAGAPISGNMKTSAWKSLGGGGVEKKPVAYVSGCTPRIGACLVKNGSAGDCSNPNPGEGPAGVPASYFARGNVLDPHDQPTGLFLPAAPLQRAAAGNIYEYPATAISEILPPGKVQYMENFRILWEWSVTSDPNGTWSACGISENPLYVTRSLPKPENPGVGYRHFHTLLYIGCKYADGATTEDAMIQGVWAHFEGRAVARVDGAPLKYYGNWSGGNLASRTDDLLERKDGMCLAWTRLLLDVFKMQGFQESGNVTTVKPRESQYMLIKKWKQDVASGTSGNSKYPFKNIENTPFYLNNSYNWEYREVLIESPSNSQNNNNPQSDFGIHIFVKTKELFYDPSYGVFYGAANTIEDPLIPMEMIQILPIMDDLYISAYTIKPIQNTVHNIQLNNLIDSDFIFIDDLQVQNY